MTAGFSGFNFHSSLRHASHGGADAARDARSDVRQVEHEVERLLMITEALWTFMKEQHGYTDEDLIKQVARIDARDGRLDGRVAKSADGLQDCAKCGRPVGRTRPTCLYCGAAVVRDPFER